MHCEALCRRRVVAFDSEASEVEALARVVMMTAERSNE